VAKWFNLRAPKGPGFKTGYTRDLSKAPSVHHYPALFRPGEKDGGEKERHATSVTLMLVHVGSPAVTSPTRPLAKRQPLFIIHLIIPHQRPWNLARKEGVNEIIVQD